MERILAKLVALSKDLTADQSLELVFDGRTEHLTFYKVNFNRVKYASLYQVDQSASATSVPAPPASN